ncbi:MAG: DUF669 domain-containing protein [Photobacterium halotolerans]
MYLDELFGAPVQFSEENLAGAGGGFAPLEIGNVRVSVDSVEPKEFQGGRKISYTATIIEGKGAGRKLWLDFSVQHTNPKVVEIALQEIERFFMAAGVHNPNSRPQIDAPVGRTAVIRVTYNDKSTFPNYRYLTGAGAPLAVDGNYLPVPKHIMDDYERKQAEREGAAPQGQAQQAGMAQMTPQAGLQQMPWGQ